VLRDILQARNPDEEFDAAGNFVVKRINGYNIEGKFSSDGTGLRGTLVSIHLMLSTYVNQLAEAGLLIDRTEESMLLPGDCSTPEEQMASSV